MIFDSSLIWCQFFSEVDQTGIRRKEKMIKILQYSKCTIVIEWHACSLKILFVLQQKASVYMTLRDSYEFIDKPLD